jgi:hypothetical protein
MNLMAITPRPPGRSLASLANADERIFEHEDSAVNGKATNIVTDIVP